MRADVGQPFQAAIAGRFPSSFLEKCNARHLQRPAFIAKRVECGSSLPLFDRPERCPASEKRRQADALQALRDEGWSVGMFSVTFFEE